VAALRIAAPLAALCSSTAEHLQRLLLFRWSAAAIGPQHARQDAMSTKRIAVLHRGSRSGSPDLFATTDPPSTGF